MRISLDRTDSPARPIQQRERQQTGKPHMKPRRTPLSARKLGAGRIGSPAPVDISLSFSNRRESDWFSTDTPPVVDGTYLTRGAAGISLHAFARKRWQLERGETNPLQWRGVDVSLTDDERQLLFSRLHQNKDIVAALPLLRDAAARYLAESAVAHRSLTERQQHMNVLLNACWCYLIVERSPQGAPLLNSTDREVFQPVIGALPAQTLKTIEEHIVAFENGQEL